MGDSDMVLWWHEGKRTAYKLNNNIDFNARHQLRNELKLELIF